MGAPIKNYTEKHQGVLNELLSAISSFETVKNEIPGWMIRGIQHVEQALELLQDVMIEQGKMSVGLGVRREKKQWIEKYQKKS